MKIEQKGSKGLKKIDDTQPRHRKKRDEGSKLIGKPKSKRQSKKTLKLLPGQQKLTFKTNLFPAKNKTVQFLCVNENTMGWPEEFTNKIIPHSYDNDQDSEEYIVSKQIQKGIAILVEQITFKRILEMEDTMGF